MGPCGGRGGMEEGGNRDTDESRWPFVEPHTAGQPLSLPGLLPLAHPSLLFALRHCIPQSDYSFAYFYHVQRSGASSCCAKLEVAFEIKKGENKGAWWALVAVL